MPVSKCLVAKSLFLLEWWDLFYPVRECFQQVDQALHRRHILLGDIPNFQSFDGVAHGENESQVVLSTFGGQKLSEDIAERNRDELLLGKLVSLTTFGYLQHF